MSALTQTVAFTAQVRIHDVEALRAAAAEQATRAGLSAQDWSAMRFGSNDDLVMLLDLRSVADAGFEIIQSRCEVLGPEALPSCGFRAL